MLGYLAKMNNIICIDCYLSNPKNGEGYTYIYIYITSHMIEIHFINNLLGSFFSFTNQIIKIIFTQITKIKSQITKIIISLMVNIKYKTKKIETYLKII